MCFNLLMLMFAMATGHESDGQPDRKKLKGALGSVAGRFEVDADTNVE